MRLAHRSRSRGPLLGAALVLGLLATAGGCKRTEAPPPGKGAERTPPDPGIGDAVLSGLSLSTGGLSPAFAPGTTAYTAHVPPWTDGVHVIPVAAAGVTIKVNGAVVGSAIASALIPLGPGVTAISVEAKAPDGTARSYAVAVHVSDGAMAYVKPSNTDLRDTFGSIVSLSGDALAVSAPFESSKATGVNGDQADNSAAQSGAVYVFRLVGGTWVQEAYLKASNAAGGSQFGWSVSLSGDALAVGAPFEASKATGVNGDQADRTANGSGAVYLFRRSGSTWAQEAYLKASNASSGDLFGYAVSLSRDALAVGAPFEASKATGVNGDQADNSMVLSGAAYLFRRSGGTWAQEAYLKASNTGKNDAFGSAVSLAGDALAVSAPVEASAATGINGDQADNTAPRSGAVYLFRRSGSAWAQEAYVKASNAAAGDVFGASLSLSGDTLAVGAPFEASKATGVNGDQADNSANAAGAVYLFQRKGDTWAQAAYLKASNTKGGERWGSSVALSGDALAVGAPFEASKAAGVDGDQTDASSLRSGAVYLFLAKGGAWTQARYIKASNSGAGDQFGLSVALSGQALAVGAPFEASKATGVNGDRADNQAENSGAVYVFP